MSPPRSPSPGRRAYYSNVSIRLLVVDPQPFFCEALTTALQRTEDLEIIGWTGDELEAERLTVSQNPEMVLTELPLTAGSGLSLARRIRGRASVVVLTRRHEGDVLLDAVEAGAMGCISHDVGIGGLRSLVLAASSGRFALDPDRLHDALLRIRSRKVADEKAGGRLARLSGREREVLGLVAAGLDDEDIGSQLYLSSKTVRTHVGNILKKLGVHTRADAARVALTMGDAEGTAHVLRIEGPLLERG